MPAGDEQRQKRKFELARRLAGHAQEHGQQMPDQMVDAHDRQARGPGQALCHLHADEQRAGQAGLARDGDSPDVLQPLARAFERRSIHGHDVLQMVPGSELGHDAAVARVRLDLAVHHVAEHGAPFIDQRDGGLVARGLDAQGQHGLRARNPCAVAETRRNLQG
jgi:hypothetical protein